MAIEPHPKLTRAGRYLMYGLGLVTVLIVVGVLVSACAGRSRPPERWTQGYETPHGQYMEPDHGYLYYWMMTRLLQQEVQPTYHVYQPPPGYAPTYRPWHEPPRSYTRTPPSAATPARSSGGFSEPSSYRPSAPASAPARHEGGFSRPSAATPSRTSGGFSKPASTPAPTRSSGGFSKPSASPPPSSSSSRSSGGFSKKQ